MEPLVHCWHSQRQENLFGYALYMIDGKLQHVTDASYDNTKEICHILWPDKKYVGLGSFHSSHSILDTPTPSMIGAQSKIIKLHPPICICCGKPHTGPVCPDGLVMCQLCFERFSIDQLNVTADGKVEDVCKQCADREERTRKDHNEKC